MFLYNYLYTYPVGTQDLFVSV